MNFSEEIDPIKSIPMFLAGLMPSFSVLTAPTKMPAPPRGTRKLGAALRFLERFSSPSLWVDGIAKGVKSPLTPL
jgi:hypothetical protein